MNRRQFLVVGGSAATTAACGELTAPFTDGLGTHDLWSNEFPDELKGANNAEIAALAATTRVVEVDWREVPVRMLAQLRAVPEIGPGHYIVVVNSRLSARERPSAIKHELSHLWLIRQGRPSNFHRDRRDHVDLSSMPLDRFRPIG